MQELVIPIKQAFKKQYLKQTLNILLFCVFLANAILLPADPFNLKIISLFCIFVINFKDIFDVKDEVELVIFILGFIVPSFTILSSAILTGDIFGNIASGYPGYILMLYPIIKKEKINFVDTVFWILLGLSLLTILIALMDVCGIYSLYKNPISVFLSDSNCAMIGKGPSLPTGYTIFIKTSPLLVIGVPYGIYRKKYFVTAIMVIALFLSGTRANIFVGVAVLYFAVVFAINNVKLRKGILIATALAAVALVVDGRVVKMIINMFVRKASSDAVRNGTLNSILSLWSDNPISLITGAGYTAGFFNDGRGAVSVSVELSYWNLLRQVGLFSFVLLMLMYLLPLFVLLYKRKYGIIALGYLGYLIIAYTNPLLYSSTGLIAVLILYCIALNKNHKGVE